MYIFISNQHIRLIIVNNIYNCFVNKIKLQNLQTIHLYNINFIVSDHELFDHPLYPQQFKIEKKDHQTHQLSISENFCFTFLGAIEIFILFLNIPFEGYFFFFCSSTTLYLQWYLCGSNLDTKISSQKQDKLFHCLKTLVMPAPTLFQPHLIDALFVFLVKDAQI